MNEDLQDIEARLAAVREVIDSARPVPLSASVMVNREELLEQIDAVLGNLPDEMRKARWILKERDEVLEKARRDAEDIIAAAREESHRLVSQQHVVREAATTAKSMIEEARGVSRKNVLQAEDYIDQKLGTFEVALQRTLETVEKARQRLQKGAVHADDFEAQATPEEDRFATPPPQHFDVVDQTGEHFFDQDVS